MCEGYEEKVLFFLGRGWNFKEGDRFARREWLPVKESNVLLQGYLGWGEHNKI